MRFAGKVAVITGAANGIGKATALQLATEGARIALCDLKADQLGGVADQARALGAQVMALPVDVSNQADVANAVAKVVGEFGRLDILVHCAGIMSSKQILDCDMAEWNRVIGVNLTGTYNVCQPVVKQMVAQGGGRIVMTSSAAAKSPHSNAGIAYAASKAGMLSFVRQLSYQFGRNGLTVNAVCPGTVATEMPYRHFEAGQLEARLAESVAGRMARPEEIAELMLHLVSDAGSYITGEAVNITGGTFID
ncbi:MAG: 3-oxoacyl-ACP reductase FabG [Firmicutes bacterium]|nr:3-oxoacyl-ACP reductase FabG [Bacillota bacterium]